MGLAVARSLVQLHGGAIEATSAGPNQGSTFIVRLPLAAALAVSTPIATDAHALATPAWHAGPVMVVDDNRDALDMLLAALQQSGLPAFGASRSDEALDLAMRLHPAVAVLDIGLLGMDGFGLARALRSLNTAVRCG